MFLSNFTEPHNLTIEIMNLTSAMLCWHKPRYGRVKRYEILYAALSKLPTKSREMVRKMQEKRQCHTLVGLESYEEYVLEIRAWGNNQPGALAKAVFLMDKDSEYALQVYSVYALSKLEWGINRELYAPCMHSR